MKEKRIYLLAISLVILIIDVALIFILNTYSVKITSVLYIISKCVAVISFLGIVALGICKRDPASYILQYAIAIMFQFVPLAIRYISILNNGYIVSIIVFFVSIIIYISLELGLLALRNKSIKASEYLIGKEITIREEQNLDE